MLRMALFAGKMLSLSWVCWPYTSGWAVLAVVVGMAVMDLQAQGDARHDVPTVWVRPGSVAGMPPGTDGSVPGELGRGHTREGSGVGWGRSWIAGWRRSVILLVMHCVVLGVTAQLGVLCAGGAGRTGWEEE